MKANTQGQIHVLGVEILLVYSEKSHRSSLSLYTSQSTFEKRIPQTPLTEEVWRPA